MFYLKNIRYIHFKSDALVPTQLCLKTAEPMNPVLPVVTRYKILAFFVKFFIPQWIKCFQWIIFMVFSTRPLDEVFKTAPEKDKHLYIIQH